MCCKIVCLMGPTASGKTQLSLQLAEEFACEIVSVDSAMVYKGMDIGTAKPSIEERARVKHYLIDLLSPTNPYSAAKFQEDALAAIASIHAQGKTPLLVGGTMLYFKALQQGLSLLPAADDNIRARLSHEAAVIGWEAMHARLAVVDPLSAARISPTDPQRIQRALEVYEITGQPLSSLWRMQAAKPLPFDIINIAISPTDRTLLHQRIEHRFKKMLQEGFIEEVKALVDSQALDVNLPSMRSVGYRQVWQYLEGRLTYTELSEKGIAATRQLAKRQLTWLRQWKEVVWFDSAELETPKKLTQFLKSTFSSQNGVE